MQIFVINIGSIRLLLLQIFVINIGYVRLLFVINLDFTKTKLLLFVSNFFISVRLQNFISFNLRN